MNKRVIFFFTILMNIPFLMSSQNKVDLGLFLGYGEHGSDVHSWGRHGAMLTENAAFAYGLNLKMNFTDNLGARVNFWGSEISGQDQNLTELEGHNLRDFSFTSPIKELSLALEYDLLGKRRWRGKSENNFTSGSSTKIFNRIVSPYIFGGVGLSFTNPEVDFGGMTSQAITDDIENTTTTNFQIPIGGGFRFDLTPTVYVSAEASSRIPLSDYLEGISASANPDKKDSYQFIGMNVGFRIGARDDKDGDGIIDSKDNCPTVPGIKEFAGCPDSDGDGIMDSEDNCPNLAGIIEFKGCPDTDGDGIIDTEDVCPKIAGLNEYKGCPDTDGDSIPDNEDECPADAGLPANNGCPIMDRDNDGFVDAEDDCPDTPGTIKGCPDTDNDGFVDVNDACPTIPGNLNGCPDSDGDGLADNIDSCPNEAGPVVNKGCPRGGKSRADIINEFVINDIYFDSNQSAIKSDSKFRIEEIVAFSRQFPEASFIITGHTDNRNSNQYNMNLSEKRAKRVQAALIKLGVNPSKLSIDYKGEAQPTSSNATEAEMQRNRRVEVRAVLR